MSPSQVPAPCAKEIEELIWVTTAHVGKNSSPLTPAEAEELLGNAEVALQSAISAHTEEAYNRGLADQSGSDAKIVVRLQEDAKRAIASAVSEATAPLVEALERMRWRTKSLLDKFSPEYRKALDECPHELSEDECPWSDAHQQLRVLDDLLKIANKALAPYLEDGGSSDE